MSNDELLVSLHDYERLEAEIERLRRAISNAEYHLHPNQGERPDLSLASQWLRSTYPKDHPCYIDEPRYEDQPGADA